MVIYISIKLFNLQVKDVHININRVDGPVKLRITNFDV